MSFISDFVPEMFDEIHLFKWWKIRDQTWSPNLGGHDEPTSNYFKGSRELTIISEVNSSTESAMALIEGANDMHLWAVLVWYFYAISIAVVFLQCVAIYVLY